MGKKSKFVPCLVLSREALDAEVAEVVKLQLQVQKLKTEMEQEIAKVQERYQEKILPLCSEIETKEVGIHLFCQQNRDSLFPVKKSMDCLLAEIGFETNPFKVEKTRSKDSWGAVVKRLLTLPWGADYVRDGDPEVDKQALIAARATLTAAQLKEAGIEIVQEEQFFIRPKSEIAAGTVIKSEAA